MLAENHSSLLGNVSAVNNCIERHPGFFQGIFHEGVIIRRDYDHRVQGRRGQKSMNLGDVPRSKICAACLPAGYWICLRVIGSYPSQVLGIAQPPRGQVGKPCYVVRQLGAVGKKV
jgi:hypothetical protein